MTELYAPMAKSSQFWDVRKLESVQAALGECLLWGVKPSFGNRIADTRQPYFGSLKLNVCSYPKRSFKRSENGESERLLSAKTRHQRFIRSSSWIDQVFGIAVHQHDHQCSLPVLVRNQLEIPDEHENPNDIDRSGIHDDRM